MTDPVTRLNAALEGRYRVERQLGVGGMATAVASLSAPVDFSAAHFSLGFWQARSLQIARVPKHEQR